MKLADWLFENSMTPGQLRRMLGGVNRSTVHRYLMNTRIPRPEMMRRILRITQNRVTLMDFLDGRAPECAVLIKNSGEEEKFVLPWSPEYQAARTVPHQSERLTSPVHRAIYALEGRARFTPRGAFLLDGRISDPKRVVEVAFPRHAAFDSGFWTVASIFSTILRIYGRPQASLRTPSRDRCR